MDDQSLYERDIYAWAETQAAALRRLAETRRDLPNGLDVENIAEEIEDVGSSELHRVESFVEVLLLHLLKLASAPDAVSVRHWRNEVDLAHHRVVRFWRPSMSRKLGLDDVWKAALIQGDTAPNKYGDTLLTNLPKPCPFEIVDLVSPAFDMDVAVTRLREISAGNEAAQTRL